MRVLLCLLCLGILVLGCTPETKKSESDQNFEKYGQEFEGKISQSYEESEEWWPKKKRPPADAPNVIIFLLDDVGFAQVESFGGLIKTPNIDALAAGGLRYNNFHTTALCSPSRATLMAGRNPHKIGLGSHALTAMGFPGYNAIVPPSAKSVANYLQEEGYVNYA
ncbi:MAG: sulfatase-like hydrolase/transferase, partial [Flavobacteriaceae bacterium]